MREVVIAVALMQGINLFVVIGYDLWVKRRATRAQAVEDAKLAAERAMKRQGSDARVVTAVLDACVSVGLPREQLAPTFDLKRTGKLYDVLHIAGADLGRDPELETLQDVIDWLMVAPEQDDHDRPSVTH